MTEVGKAIAEARKKAGMTQVELAKAIGVKQSQIANWESGWRNPKLEALMKISDALKIDVTDLIDL